MHTQGWGPRLASCQLPLIRRGACLHKQRLTQEGNCQSFITGWQAGGWPPCHVAEPPAFSPCLQRRAMQAQASRDRLCRGHAQLVRAAARTRPGCALHIWQQAGWAHAAALSTPLFRMLLHPEFFCKLAGLMCSQMELAQLVLSGVFRFTPGQMAVEVWLSDWALSCPAAIEFYARMRHNL